MSVRGIWGALACAALLGCPIVLICAAPIFAQELPPRREPRPSIAAPQLQAEVRPRVLAVATALMGPPACQPAVIAATAFNGWTGERVAGAAEPGRPWEETWMVRLCGRLVDVLVQFAPDGQGIRFAVPARAAFLRP